MTTSRTAFTLIELLVVIAIISILAGMAIATLNMVRKSAQGTACRSNQRQIGLAIATYAGDNRGYIPPVKIENSVDTNARSLINTGRVLYEGRWFGFLHQYVSDFNNSPIFLCPTWVRRSDAQNPALDVGPLHALYSISYGMCSWYQANVITRDMPYEQWRWKLMDSRVRTAFPPRDTVHSQSALLAEKWAVAANGQFSTETTVHPNWEAKAAFGDRPAPAANPGASDISQRFSHSSRCNVLFYDLHVAAVTLQESGLEKESTSNMWEGR